MGLLQDETYAYGPAPDPTEAELDRALIGHLTKGGLLGSLQHLGKGLLNYMGKTATDNNAAVRRGGEATGKMLKGETLSPEQQKAMAENPAMGIGNADMAAGGFAGTFAGVGAKTADLVKLREAETLLKNGASEAEIRGRTGWFKGADDKWRFEIPDNNLRITADGFEHPELFAAYPDMKDIGVKRFEFDETQQIAGYSARDHVGIADTMTDEEVRSTLAHELQHNVQAKEGFSNGTYLGDPAVQDAAINELTRTRAEAKRIATEHDKSLGEWMRKNGGVGGWFGPSKDQLTQFHEQYPDLAAAHEQAQEFLGRIRSLRGLFETFSQFEFNAYQRALGETEARAVQDRLDYTPDQRRMTPPLDTQVGPGKPAEDMSRIIVLPPRENAPAVDPVPPDPPAAQRGLLDWFR